MDREYLLAAIKANSTEDLPRLLYADWLEEFGNHDRDAATVEFIKLSCRMRHGGTSNVMPRAAYTWLRDNWKRLVPETLKLHVSPPAGTLVRINRWGPMTPTKPDSGPVFEVMGRNVWMRIALRGEGRNQIRAFRKKPYNCSCELEFFRGFCVEFRAWSDFTHHKIRPVLELEQPLVTFPWQTPPAPLHPGPPPSPVPTVGDEFL